MSHVKVWRLWTVPCFVRHGSLSTQLAQFVFISKNHPKRRIPNNSDPAIVGKHRGPALRQVWSSSKFSGSQLHGIVVAHRRNLLGFEYFRSKKNTMCRGLPIIFTTRCAVIRQRRFLVGFVVITSTACRAIVVSPGRPGSKCPKYFCVPWQLVWLKRAQFSWPEITLRFEVANKRNYN